MYPTLYSIEIRERIKLTPAFTVEILDSRYLVRQIRNRHSVTDFLTLHCVDREVVTGHDGHISAKDERVQKGLTRMLSTVDDCGSLFERKTVWNIYPSSGYSIY